MNRSDRLSKYLLLIDKGKKSVATEADAKHLLEALCAEENHLRCIEKLLSSKSSLSSLERSFRINVSPRFINTTINPFLSYLRHPSIEGFCAGKLVQQILLHIVEPPTFWNAFLEAHLQHLLEEEAEANFTWVLFHLLSSRRCSSDIIKAAREISMRGSFLTSSSDNIRSIGYRIDNILKNLTSGMRETDSYGPGGRHDNDFDDFREISIMPTPDEIGSTDLPFYRKAEEIYDVPMDRRPVTHQDNQFRLLREDLLAELRTDLQIACGQTKGKRSSSPITGLRFEGVDCGHVSQWRRCRLGFRCTKGIPQLSQLSGKERKSLLEENPNVVRDQAFGCLLTDAKVVAFASIDRRASSLLDDSPILSLNVEETGLARLLVDVKMRREFTFVVVNTPVFAYEPILRRLKEKVEFPMAELLLSSEPRQQRLVLNEALSDIVDQIKSTQGNNLHKTLRLRKKISLDSSQTQSLLDGLEQCVSIIQGPPGKDRMIRSYCQHAKQHIRHREIIHWRPDCQNPPRPYGADNYGDMLYQSRLGPIPRRSHGYRNSGPLHGSARFQIL